MPATRQDCGDRSPITEEVRYEELDDAEHYAGHCLFGSDGRGCAPGRGQATRATVGARRRIRADCGEDTRLPGPASAVEQMQDIFHELHADGRNAACTVCDSHYWLA